MSALIPRIRVNLLLIVLGLISLSVLQASSTFPTETSSGAFLNGRIVTLQYTANYICSPSVSSIYPGSSNISIISSFTNCTVRTPGNLYSTFPVWEIYPAYAGLSTFGINSSTSSVDQEYPIYNGAAIHTDCGSEGTPAACNYVPRYIYGSNTFKTEREFNIYNGLNNGTVPEGIFPFQSYDYILLDNYSGIATPWYVVLVRVFDPNIFPNATTGKCTQVAPSNLSNPTGNCLTSFAALQKAYVTKNSYIPTINANNIIWLSDSSPTTQIQIALTPNVIGVSGLLYPDTNIYLIFRVNQTDFYSNAGYTGPSFLNASGITGLSNSSASDIYVFGLGTIAFVIVVSAVWWFTKGQERAKRGLKKKN